MSAAGTGDPGATGACPVDHIVWAAPDLDAACRAIEALTGVTPQPGGEHAGRGTRNALLAFDHATYLEALAPTVAAQAAGGGPLAGLAAPQLTGWAARSHHLDAVAAAFDAAGIAHGGVIAMGRLQPDGTRLDWRLVIPRATAFGGLLPFFIDWGDCPHPSTTTPVAGGLEQLVLRTPDAAALRRVLALTGAGADPRVRVVDAGEAQITARLLTRSGAQVLAGRAPRGL